MNISIFIVLVGILFVVGGALALWRFSSLHASGTQVVIRALPARDGHGWRHGVMHYSDSCLKIYKLRSLRPGVDLQLARQDIQIEGRREATPVEASFFASGVNVLRISTSSQGEWELALDHSDDNGLVSWVESMPSTRQTRALPTDIERRFEVMNRREHY